VFQGSFSEVKTIHFGVRLARKRTLIGRVGVRSVPMVAIRQKNTSRQSARRGNPIARMRTAVRSLALKSSGLLQQGFDEGLLLRANYSERYQNAADQSSIEPNLGSRLFHQLIAKGDKSN